MSLEIVKGSWLREVLDRASRHTKIMDLMRGEKLQFMQTICWDGHSMEYLQDQTTCRELGCGENSQHMPRRFNLGERAEMAARSKAPNPTRDERQREATYNNGYGAGFEAGILAERKRVKR